MKEIVDRMIIINKKRMENFDKNGAPCDEQLERELSKQFYECILQAKRESRIVNERNKRVEKYCSEVMERAFKKAVKLAYDIRTSLDELSCSSCPFESAFYRCRKNGICRDCISRWEEEILNEVEREIEEKKND